MPFQITLSPIKLLDNLAINKSHYVSTISPYVTRPNLHQHIKVIQKIILSSPCLWASFTLYLFFQWFLQSILFLLNLHMKCYNSSFNAQGSKLVIIVVHIGVVEI
jgi:hypothetical protein